MDYISEFDIHLDREVWYPGEQLTGFVLLKTIENFKLKAIKVLLRGKAHCEWKMLIQHEKRNVKDEEIFIDDRALIFGNDKEPTLPKILPRGSHVFQFRFSLPESQLPCSFESKFCTVRYYLKVTLEIPYSSSPQGIKYFSIIGPYTDCMHNMKPLVSNKSDKICCFCTTTYSTQLKCNLERSAFCSGEVIRVKGFVHNNYNSPVILKIKLIQNFSCSINRGVLGLKKESTHVILEYTGDEIAMESRSKFDTQNSIVLPVVPPTVDASVCRLMNISYCLKVWIESDKSKEILLINFPILIATSPFRIPNSPNLPVIEYEVACQHSEGGDFISPEFQLGQVYDGTNFSHEEVVLYRPMYLCVRRNKELKDLHSKESKDSRDSQANKETNPKELHSMHSKHSSLNKESSIQRDGGNEQITNEASATGGKRTKKQHSKSSAPLKNQLSLDSVLTTDKIELHSKSDKRSSLACQMPFNKLKLSSLDEGRIDYRLEDDEFNILENNNLISESNNTNKSADVIRDKQPRSSIH